MKKGGEAEKDKIDIYLSTQTIMIINF